jgi:hypothetical protein
LFNRLIVTSLACIVACAVACDDVPSGRGADGGIDAAVGDGPSSETTPTGTVEAGTLDVRDVGMADAFLAGDAGAEITSACNTWAEALCQRLDPPCPDRVPPNGWADEAACRADAARACELQLTSPGVAERPADRMACADAVRALDCNGRFQLYINNPPAACRDPGGTLAAGAPCAFSWQCQRELFCQISPGGSCGACAPRTIDPSGACTRGVYGTCARGQACLMIDGVPPCVSAGGFGQICGARGSACDEAFTCHEWHCRLAPAVTDPRACR